MPLYSYRCVICGRPKEVIHSMDEPKIPECCNQEMQRNFQADLPNTSGRDYSRPIISDSLAINPSQRTEHERLFPDIQVTPQGQPVLDNYKKHDAYLKKCGFVKPPKRNRRRFSSKIGGEKSEKSN